MPDNFSLNKTSPITISGDEKLLNVVLSPKGTSETSTITGFVYNTVAEPEQIIIGATVTVLESSGAPIAHAITTQTGEFTLQIQPGSYQICAIHEGFLLSKEFTIHTKADETTTQNILLLPDPNATLNTIYGMITDSLSNKGLDNCQIHLLDEQGTKEIQTTTSTKDGDYLLSSLSDGTYQLVFEREGYYATGPISVQVENSAVFLQNMSMDLDPTAQVGAISGTIKDTLGAFVNGAFVGLYQVVGSKEVLVATTTTNAKGRYLFGNVEQGQYIVKAKANF